MRALLTGILLLVGMSAPDKGGLPFARVNVTEPKQSALIAFDGSTEVLYISSVLRPAAKTKILEILPLPGEPTAELADPEVIQRAAKLYNARVEALLDERARQRRREETRRILTVVALFLPILCVALILVRRGHRVSGLLVLLLGVLFLAVGIPGYLGAARLGAPGTTVEVLSEQHLGPHSITIVKTREPADISTWVADFIRREGGDAAAFDQGWRDLLESYVRNGCPFFAVDLIDADPASGPIAPIRYTFPAKEPWFPFRISSRGTGASDVLLMLLLPRGSRWRTPRYEDFPEANEDLGFGFDMSASELKSVDPVLEERFKAVPSKLYAARFQRRLEELKSDFVLQTWP